MTEVVTRPVLIASVAFMDYFTWTRQERRLYFHCILSAKTVIRGKIETVAPYGVTPKWHSVQVLSLSPRAYRTVKIQWSKVYLNPPSSIKTGTIGNLGKNYNLTVR